MGKKKLGFSSRQIEAGAKARDRASQSTPKVVVEAFLPDRVLAGNLELQPVTMSTIITLQKVGSRLLKTNSADDLEMEEIAKALFVMTRPIADVRKLISARIFDISVIAMADLIPAALLPQIGKLLNDHLTNAFATAVPHGPSDRSDGQSPFPAARTPEPGMAG